MFSAIYRGAFQKRGSRSKEQQWQRINEEGVSFEERKRRSNLDRKDCFASLAMTRSHLWGVATILANTFFRECTQLSS